uniref:Uncharacterized protein n=1 Tax=Ananas comosus var. bracteatus TaxID=296719 RepID=A0A6V7Q4P9_ANACO|nr:unnamed protein product [Ananas comosus var. bracteatus]
MGRMGTLLELAKGKLLQFLYSIYLYLLKKAGEALTPEARAEADWAHLTYIGLAVFVVLLVLYSCCCCGGGTMKAPGRRGGGTMKAPGRRGKRISRAGFESNPSGYFKNLRSKKE